MKRGLAATKQKQWDLAIDHFTRAHDAAPESADPMLSLALAYDKGGGRDVLAMLWFGSYLEARPDAPQAAQIWSRMVDLEIRVEADIRRLIDTALRSLEELDPQYRTQYGSIAVAHAAMGDFSAARDFLNRTVRAYQRNIEEEKRRLAGSNYLPMEPSAADQIFWRTVLSVAEFQLRYEDWAGARDTLDASRYGGLFTDGSSKKMKVLRDHDAVNGAVACWVRGMRCAVCLTAGGTLDHVASHRLRDERLHYLEGPVGRCVYPYKTGRWIDYAKWPLLTAGSMNEKLSAQLEWINRRGEAIGIPGSLAGTATNLAEGLRLVRWLQKGAGAN